VSNLLVCRFCKAGFLDTEAGREAYDAHNCGPGGEGDE
jgi:hypothetical protein